MLPSIRSRGGVVGASVRADTLRSLGASLRWFVVLLMLASCLLTPSMAWAAAYATGGSSPYRDAVLWLTWGGGELGTHNVVLNNGDTSSFSMPVAAGVNLDVTCGLSDISRGTLHSYRPGAYSGDGMDDLYNIGGTGNANRLIAGIARSSGVTEFRISCTSTLGGVPYRLPGLVMADAEAINDVNEYVEASAQGAWSVVELRKSIGAGAYRVTKSQDGANNVIRFGPGNYQTGAVTFLSFDAGAYAAGDLSVDMDFAISGGGTTAIAIGLLVPYADFGDAPSSYGDALHVAGALELRDDNIPDNTTNLDINTAEYAPGGLVPPTNHYLGTLGPDTEQRSSYGADARGDDDFPADNPNEEDAWPINYRLTVMQAGTVVNQPVACVGNGSVAGWLDFNRNGEFDAGERSNTAVCSGGSAALSWTVPADIEAGTSFVRLRYATNAAQIQQPTGVADDGEVEDHLIAIIAPSLRITKSNNSGDGAWSYGEAGTSYTLTVSNLNEVPTGNPPTVAPGTLSVLDDLPAGIVPGWSGSLVSNGWNCSAIAQRVTCTSNQILASSGSPGSSSDIVLPVTVASAASGTLTNYASVGGGHDPFNDGVTPAPGSTCVDANHCAQNVVEILATSVGYTKRANSTGPVAVGDTVNYTIDVTVAYGHTRDVLTLTDTLGAGLDFGSVSSAGAFTCNATNPLVCTLPADTAPGTYSLSYSAVVTAQASGQVVNTVVGTGNDTPTCTGTCATEHPLAEPRVVLDKQADPVSGTTLRPGDRLRYTLGATVERAALRSVLQLVDTPDPGLTIEVLPAACARQGGDIVCTLPAGTTPGRHEFDYEAVVNAQARNEVSNRVRGQYLDGGAPPECGNCETRHPVASDFALRITKTATPRLVKVGELVRYQLVVENLGGSDWHDGIVVDTPPAGFNYVAGSMTVADDDGAFALASSQSPLRIAALDIAVGRSATVNYLLRVGAGVRAGAHINQAVATSAEGSPLSNVASAEVRLDVDPLLEESLVFGTVFDDRDGDGWQDSAELADVRVQGGFAAGAYVPGSTTIDRGQGEQPVADASAPLLHGLLIGPMAGRGSTAESAEDGQVVVRQRLRELAFTDDFVLDNAQGVQLRMDAQGTTALHRSGDAAKGLTAAEPKVLRRVARVADGYEVAYVIRNEGIQEQGIPGVRLATVEGLLIETDPFGRYHLADVHGGDARLGRNFIVKLDPATVPAGSGLTTENPLQRRVTQGLPTRFSFGVRLPPSSQVTSERAEMVLGEVLFAPGSSELRADYRLVLAQMAEVVDRYQGGDVVIVADGDSQELAFARASAVRDALQAEVAEASRAALTVQLRTQVDDPHSLLAGVDARGAVLGTVLFDTDKAAVREEFKSLLAGIARRLEAMGGGQVSLVGHTDVRGSHVYNQALGLRRAEAVFEALRSQLSPAVQQRVRVLNQESAATRAAEQQQEVRR